MKKQWNRIVAVALIASAAPASAIPVQFDVAGTVTGVVDYDLVTGDQVYGQGPLGSSFSARFMFDTDLFGPAVPEEAEFSERLTYAAQLPGALSASLVIGGVNVDIFAHESDSASLNFNDSLGVFSCGDGCQAFSQDAWGLNFESQTVTDIGRTALRTGYFTFAADFVDINRPELSMGWLDFDEGIEPADIATLPFPTTPATLNLVDWNFDCSERCVRTGMHMTVLEMTSVTRTVGSVPEPGTLGLLALGAAGVMLASRRRRVVRA